jgi:hypothetical protein
MSPGLAPVFTFRRLVVRLGLRSKSITPIAINQLQFRMRLRKVQIDEFTTLTDCMT